MNKKDPIYIYSKLIIKNANFFIFLVLLSFVFSYLTIKNNKSNSKNSITLNYASSFMQITPLDPLYFNNSSEFRLNLKDSYYIKFVRQYIRDFKKRCSMGNYPKEVIEIKIPGTTSEDDYKIALSSIQINYFDDYSETAEICLKRAFDDFKNYENKEYLKLFKKIFIADNIITQNFESIDAKNFGKGFETESEVTNVQLNYFFFRDMLDAKKVLSGLNLPSDDQNTVTKSLEMLSDKVITNAKSKILIRFEPMQIFSIKNEYKKTFNDLTIKILFIYLFIFFSIGLILLFLDKNLFKLGFIKK